MTALEVSIAILTMNRRDAVIRAIDSAYNSIAQTSAVCEIIVVDNASSDGTYGVIESLFSEVKLIRLDRNLGCPGGRNILYENCKGSIIINLDDDGMLSPDLINKTIRAFSATHNLGILAYNQFESIEETECIRENGTLMEVASFSGGLSAFRKKMIDEIGLYPEDYFLLSEEEHMALRASDAGYKIMFANNIGMVHAFESQSQNNSWDYYRFRNSLFNVLELFPFPYVFSWLFFRVFSNLRHAWNRKSLFHWTRAVATVVVFGWTRKRTPVNSITMRKYLALRSSGAGEISDSVKDFQ